MNGKLASSLMVAAMVMVTGGALAPAAKAASEKPAARIAAPAAPELKIVDLTKAEALQVMSMQYSVSGAEGNLAQMVSRRQDLIKRLEDKYKVSINEYIFDISTGFFVPRKPEGDATKEKKDLLAELKPVEVSKEDSLLITNISYAIESTASDLRQMYTKRQELVKSLEDKYKVSLGEYDLDVMNGRFAQRAKVEDPTPAAPAAAAAKPAK